MVGKDLIFTWFSFSLMAGCKEQLLFQLWIYICKSYYIEKCRENTRNSLRIWQLLTFHFSLFMIFYGILIVFYNENKSPTSRSHLLHSALLKTCFKNSGMPTTLNLEKWFTRLLHHQDWCYFQCNHVTLLYFASQTGNQ